MKNNKKKIAIILLVISAVLALYGYFVLPEIVKVKSNGENALPKISAVLLPLVITTLGSIMYVISEKLKEVKYFILSIVGIAIQIVTIIMNR